MSDRLERARRQAEERMARLREGLDTELGLAAPRGKGAWILLAAGAVGFALAVGVAAKKRKARKRTQDVGSGRRRET